MIASNDFLSPHLPNIPHIDASSSLDGLGPVELEHPTQDIDGDGTFDTTTTSTDDGVIVATDTDLDGYADHLTIVENGGEFASWEFHHNLDGEAHWERIDHGKLGE